MNDRIFDDARYSVMMECCDELREGLREGISKRRLKEIMMMMLRLLDEGDRIARMDVIVEVSHSDVLHRIWRSMKSNKGLMEEIKNMDNREDVYLDRFL